MTPEEEQALLMGALTQRPPEKPQETSPLQAARGAEVVEKIDDNWRTVRPFFYEDPDIPPRHFYRVPDQYDEVGTRKEASEFQKAAAEWREQQRKQAEYEQMMDELLEKWTTSKTSTPPSGGYKPPPFPKAKP